MHSSYAALVVVLTASMTVGWLWWLGVMQVRVCAYVCASVCLCVEAHYVCATLPAFYMIHGSLIPLACLHLLLCSLNHAHRRDGVPAASL